MVLNRLFAMDHITILRLLLRKDKSYFDVPAEQQRSFLYSLPEPNNDMERSYYQYKCQNYFSPWWKPILLNFIAFILFIPLLLHYVFKGFFIYKINSCDAISDLGDMQEVIPSELLSEHNITFFRKHSSGSLRLYDVMFVLGIFLRKFPSCFFSLKVMARIAYYSQLIRNYCPNCIVVHHEYSFTSSLLTSYCTLHGVQHINVMHGEKLYNIVDAFFRFDKCYVWSNHYVKLFPDLRADSSQFIVSLPPSMKIDIASHKNVKLWSDYKYYLASFTENQIRGIVKSLSFAKKEGKTVKYRIHPRHQDLGTLLKYVNRDEIEFPQEVTIIDSISNCSVAVGSYSTVLNQAFCSGRSVLLDDVTFKDQYDRLEDLRYWLIGENCPRLSEKQ